MKWSSWHASWKSSICHHILFSLKPRGESCSLVSVDLSEPWPHDSASSPFTDSRGNPRCITNSKGRKRRPGTKDLPTALKTTDGLFLDFLCRCLDWDPTRRMTPEEALQHDWILEVSQALSLSLYLPGTRSHDICFLFRGTMVVPVPSPASPYPLAPATPPRTMAHTPTSMATPLNRSKNLQSDDLSRRDLMQGQRSFQMVLV